MSWLKDEPENISLIYVTLETSHELISWLKVEPQNIQLILVTLETSHELISWLKSVLENIPLISSTLETSHNSIPEKSLLDLSNSIKYIILSFPINSLLMSVIFEVSISPR